jgi:hypothetical protein
MADLLPEENPGDDEDDNDDDDDDDDDNNNLPGIDESAGSTEKVPIINPVQYTNTGQIQKLKIIIIIIIIIIIQ